MNVTLEETTHLNREELSIAEIIADTIRTRCTTLDQAIEWTACLSGWFVYRGGSHIAVHLKSGDDRRIMCILANQ